MFANSPVASTDVVEAKTMDCSAAELAFIAATVTTSSKMFRAFHTSSLPAVRARPANAKTVALIEILIPTNTAPRAKANDRSPWLV